MNSNEFVLTLLSINRWGKKKVLDYIASNNFDFNKALLNLDNNLNSNELCQFKENYQKVKKNIQDNQNKGIKLITLFDKEFPNKLYKYPDPCIYLYYFGDISLLNSKCISIIGTRNPDNEFISKGKIASEYFAKQGYTIVSGLALGCDSIAHNAAVNNNSKTIAILPSDLINISPKENFELAIKIAKTGLLISEYEIGHKCNNYCYAERDRIQSLLSEVVLVIQSSNTGGTMICVRKSIKDNKKVFALKGNNLDLIKDYIDTNLADLRKVEEYIR